MTKDESDVGMSEPIPPPAHPTGYVSLSALKCLHCHYQWVPRVPNPAMCPKCHHRDTIVPAHAILTPRQMEEFQKKRKTRGK
jgi:hypothetical protein